MSISSVGNLGAPISALPETAPPRVATADERSLIQAVKAVNGANLFGHDKELSFIVDRNTRQAIVRIVNRETREVIAQIPNEHVLRLAEEISS
jgi:uncharacterized FlaG/YvyC family protein